MTNKTWQRIHAEVRAGRARRLDREREIAIHEFIDPSHPSPLQRPWERAVWWARRAYRVMGALLVTAFFILIITKAWQNPLSRAMFLAALAVFGLLVLGLVWARLHPPEEHQSRHQAQEYAVREPRLSLPSPRGRWWQRTVERLQVVRVHANRFMPRHRQDATHRTQRNSMKIAGRCLYAVIVGLVLGQIIALPFGFLIDAIYGYPVTGGGYPITLPNVSYVILQALLTGFIAAYLAKWRGILVAVIADIFPLLALIAIEIYANRIVWNHVTVVQWTWLGLLPAAIGGYLADRYGRLAISGFFMVLAFATGLVVILGGLVLHFYTVVVAYDLAGTGAAVITFSFPVLSEIYWGLSSWISAHHVITEYDWWLLLYVAISAVCGFCFAIALWIEERTGVES